MNEKNTNRLIDEKSPYLLQHAYNPVDWYPWGEEAFEKAKMEDKPIFLSIGYSTCHWCHVMGRESFEDEEVAELLNEYFVPIKVDREERPDLDNIYMTITQAMTGQGGWPMNVFLTPDKKPIYAGTYFPKRSILDRVGLMDILYNINKAWKEKREDIVENSEDIIQKLNNIQSSSNEELGKEVLEDVFNERKEDFDPKYGGFGTRPKFPMPHNLIFLIRFYKESNDEKALEMIEKTLDGMYKGGIFDHIGFGFSRYSVDEKWLVPHFEKMLYDNALLAYCYLEGYQVTGEELYKEVAEKIFTYIIRDMTSDKGGFYSAEDADSEGVEGKFYVWTKDEIKDILGDEAGEVVCNYFDITATGNFEGKNIPNLIKHDLNFIKKSPDLINRVHAYADMLFYTRENRIKPHKDDKILTSWNGLMIAAFAYGGRILNKPLFINRAKESIEFIYENLFDENGRLLARYRDGEARYKGYLEDYTFLTWGLIEIYEATFDDIYLERAKKLMNDTFRLFWDNENGGFFINGHDAEELVLRPKEIYDGAIPSGNSVAAFNIIKLSKMLEDESYKEKYTQMLKSFSSTIKNMPHAHSFFLLSYMEYIKNGKNIVIAYEKEDDLFHDIIKEINSIYLPFTTVVKGKRDLKDNKTTVYICENYSCNMPINNLEDFKKALK
ncbi:thioredoxin domain-containing protein [Senegalia massiliensis]|uniref:thioredoxin domain-containing protein n=1 Tax=Senegalia massiliensis TaxID=1720316 RepID=UPI00103017A3|nr:thioredoxin domain-containing protein [Senegalia massiliensis]